MVIQEISSYIQRIVIITHDNLITMDIEHFQADKTWQILCITRPTRLFAMTTLRKTGGSNR